MTATVIGPEGQHLVQTMKDAKQVAAEISREHPRSYAKAISSRGTVRGFIAGFPAIYEDGRWFPACYDRDRLGKRLFEKRTVSCHPSCHGNHPFAVVDQVSVNEFCASGQGQRAGIHASGSEFHQHFATAEEAIAFAQKEWSR